MGVGDHSWGEIAEYLEGVLRRRPALGEVVDLQGRILRAQHAAALAIAARAVGGGSDRLSERNRQGLPVLPRGEFAIDVPAAAALFHALVAALSDAGAGAREHALPIQRALETGALDVQTLLRGGVRGEEGGAMAGLHPERLLFLAEASLRPHAEALGKALGRWVEGDRWHRPACPVCGSPPKIAELRGAELAASRYLHCGFCGWAWAYRRSGCPFCETADHRAMELLLIEDDPRVKIEGCKACRRYLKVADNKEFFGLIPWLEEITSPHLDLVALERGYR